MDVGSRSARLAAEECKRPGRLTCCRINGQGKDSLGIMSWHGSARREQQAPKAGIADSRPGESIIAAHDAAEAASPVSGASPAANTIQRPDGAHWTFHAAHSSGNEPAINAEQGLPVTDGLTSDELLEQATQLAAVLQKQAADLERREKRLHQQLALLDQQDRTTRMFRAEFEEERDAALAEWNQRETEVLARAADLTAEESRVRTSAENVERSRQELEQERDAWRRAEAIFRAELAAEREELLASVEREREGMLAELVPLRESAESDRRAAANELAAGRETLRLEREELEAEFRQDRVLLENRLRFQQEHLDRTRDELERSQVEFRVEQQAARVWLEEQQFQVFGLRRHLDERHDLLAEKSASIEREQDLIVKSRRALEAGLAADRDQLVQDRESFERERDTTRADLRRQLDLLALHAENLETRRHRLDQLRAELEETNRKTLETRVAVEEAFSRLTQQAGPDVARQRVEESRQVLAEYYRFTRDALIQQRLEIDQAQQRLVQQRQQLDADRHALAAWGAEQQEQVTRRERQLDELRGEIDAREQDARTLRERWLSERREAEAVIRQLLEQLETRAAALRGASD